MTVLLLFTIAVCDLIPLLTVSSLPGVSSSADGGRMLRRVLCVGALVIIAVLALLVLPVPWWSGPAAARLVPLAAGCPESSRAGPRRRGRAA